MDTFDRRTRSRIMATVKSKGSRIEKQATRILRKAGIKGLTIHAKGLVGNPDLVIARRRMAIFVDSCFWHGCPKHLRVPSSNKRYWRAKLDMNIARDISKRSKLRRQGWSVMRIWEHDLSNPAGVTKRVLRAVAQPRNRSTE